MNDDLVDQLSTLAHRTVTVRAPDGRPVADMKAMHVAAIGVAGIVFAPRLAAMAALGALLAGVTVTVEVAETPAPGEPA